MSDFRQLSDSFWASPQIFPDDIVEAHARGFSLIVNNRPDGESADQPAGAAIAAQAKALGMAYVAIPVSPPGPSESQVSEMGAALAEAKGPVLAYCRSGTRSSILWSLVQASQGRDSDAIINATAAAGYDLAAMRPMLDKFRASSQD